MSAEFRQRTPGEISEMVKRRKWLILLPVLTITTAVAYTVYRLPSVYESKSTLTVKAPMISNAVVKPLTDADISQRISGISTEVQSRSTLEPMISKYNLFERERAQNVPMELIIANMQKNISVEFVNNEKDSLASFVIRYRDNTPEAAKNVTAELASKYVTAQVTDSTNRALETQNFIKGELDTKKQLMDAIGKQRLDTMRQNMSALPDNAQGLIAQLEGFRQQDETLGRDIQGIQQEKGRLNEQIGALNRDIRLLEGEVQRQTENTLVKTSRIEDTPAFATIMSELTNLRAEKENLLREYKPVHPKVIGVQSKIKEKESLLDQMKRDGQVRVSDARETSRASTSIQTKQLENEKIRVQEQIRLADQNIAFKEQLVNQNRAQIAQTEAKINAIPGVKVMLESIDTQYDSAKKAYDELEKTQNDASMQYNRESKAQGETISIIDLANLPQTPVAPKRELLTLLGAVFGLATGLFLAAAFEIPRMFKVHTVADAKHYTGLPLLASVPPLLTPVEVSWNRRSHWLKVFVGISLAIGLIPVLIIILKVTGVFQSLVS